MRFFNKKKGKNENIRIESAYNKNEITVYSLDEPESEPRHYITLLAFTMDFADEAPENKEVVDGRN